MVARVTRQVCCHPGDSLCGIDADRFLWCPHDAPGTADD